MSSQGLSGRIEDATIRGLVWTLIGGIFALVFVVLREALRGLVDPPFDLLGASIGSAAMTALFYGSMRLTVVAANLTFIAMLAHTWARDTGVAVGSLVLIGACVGMIVGALYGVLERKSRVFCAEAKIVAGVVAGIVAGLFAILVTRLVVDVADPWLATLVGPLGILIYVGVAHWFVRHCQHWLPAGANGALVGLGVGTFSGLCFVVLAGTLNPEWIVDTGRRALIARIETYWLEAVLACAAASFVVGVARSLLRLPWYDL